MNRFVPALLALVSFAATGRGQDTSRLQEAERHMALAGQPTGLLIPLYLYPADIHTNPVYNRLLELKRTYPTVPVCVIVNPADGPGEREDGNYRQAIRRLEGAGCVVLGYVSTRYAKQPIAQVEADILAWKTMYRGVHGIFLDEQTNDESHVDHYVQACRAAHDEGFWPVVANPGANQIERYFSEPTADVIVIHEHDHYPEEAMLAGDFFGGHADYPPYRRAALVHSMPHLDRAELDVMRKHVRWLYVTDDEYRVGDAAAANPWDDLSGHLEALFDALSE